MMTAMSGKSVIANRSIWCVEEANRNAYTIDTLKLTERFTVVGEP